MKLKKLKFSYANVCEFFGGLRDFYQEKYRQNAWDDLEGVSRSEFPDTKQLYLNLEQNCIDPETGEQYLNLDSEFIPSDMFDKALQECVAQH